MYYNVLLYHKNKEMLNKPTYAIVTMDAMGTLWLVGENGYCGGIKFSEIIFLKLFVFFFC